MQTYSADLDRPLNMDLFLNSPDHDTLVLDGFEFDHIEKAFLIPETFFKYHKDIFAEFDELRKAITYRGPVSLYKLLQTLLADRLARKPLMEDNGIVQCFLQYLQSGNALSGRSQSMQISKVPLVIESRLDLSEVLLTVRPELRSRCAGWRLFMTGHGRIGIGPPRVREGDVLVVLFGGKWPFALREQNGHYMLSGHCYVDGVMDGEIVRDSEAAGELPKTFEIH